MDRFVKLERHAIGGFGFSVIGGVDTHLPPMVCAVVQNGAAHLSGKVFAGDVILEVNEKPITQLSTNEVVHCIKESSDELALRLREDSGARERARPYLRSFTVADPKIPLYQAKLHCTASAPLGPRQRASTEHLHRKTNRYQTQQINVPRDMRKTTGASADELRIAGKQNIMGYDEGADGKYSPTKINDDPYRLMTYFPVDGTPPKTFEKLPVKKQSDEHERQNNSPEDKSHSETSISTSNMNSLPKSCPNCGGTTLLASYPVGLNRDTSGPRSPTKIKCRNCGKNVQLTASGTSLPGHPYAAHHSLSAIPQLKATSLPPNTGRTTQPDIEFTFPPSHSSGLHTGNGSVVRSRDDRLCSETSSEASVSPGRPQKTAFESPRALALRLYNLDGFTKDQVAPELYKNTTFGKTIAVEYCKLFDFTGLSIVEALRIFIRTFLLTGETQERERILIPFSDRYYQCNRPEYGSADAVHTLVCAILLLNTDHHGENIGRKMTMAQFLDNMSGLCDGKDFPKELLKLIYQEIRSNPLEWSGEKPSDTPTATPKLTRNANGIRASPVNPYLEIKVNEKDKVFKDGLLYRKVTMESEGKKTSAWKRKWVPFYGTLRGMVLFLHKPDEVNSFDNTRNCLGVHHSMASRATDYKKRPFVFKFVTADWREFLFQARGRSDMNGWISAINQVAATFSAPPLPPPIGSCKRFQRPVLPFSKSKLSLAKQLEHHDAKSKQYQDELIQCLQDEPRDGPTRELMEWQEKHDYLDYEYKRYMAYVNALRGSKLESKLRDKPKVDPRSAESIMMQMKRSSSLGNLDFKSGYRAKNVRESYYMAIYQ